MPTTDEEWEIWYQNIHPLARGVVNGFDEFFEDLKRSIEERQGRHSSSDDQL